MTIGADSTMKGESNAISDGDVERGLTEGVVGSEVDGKEGSQPEPSEDNNTSEEDDSSEEGSHDRRLAFARALPRRQSSIDFFQKRATRQLNERTAREATFVLLVGVLLSFNSGYINGCCLSGLLAPGGSIQQAVSAFTGGYTKSGLALASGDINYFGFEISMILSFIGGAFISGMMNPKAVPYQLGPTYGPTFLVGSLFLIISSVLSSLHPEGRGLFYFAAAANGLQNGMTSMYTANLIRTSHLTGTSTDIGLFLGQISRGNLKNAWKLGVLMSLAASFWLGSFISFYAVTTLRSFSLVVNACLFFCIGLGCITYVVMTNHVTFWQAASGNWQWNAALSSLNVSGAVADSDKSLMEVFDRIDDDGNGYIEEHELYIALKAGGMHVTRKGLKAMISVADENNDGMISREEFGKLVRKHSSSLRDA